MSVSAPAQHRKRRLYSDLVTSRRSGTALCRRLTEDCLCHPPSSVRYARTLAFALAGASWRISYGWPAIHTDRPGASSSAQSVHSWLCPPKELAHSGTFRSERCLASFQAPVTISVELTAPSGPMYSSWITAARTRCVPVLLTDRLVSWRRPR